MARVRTSLRGKIRVHCVAQTVCHHQNLRPSSFVIPCNVIIKSHIIAHRLLLFFSSTYLLLSPTLPCILPACHTLLSSACQSRRECASHPDAGGSRACSVTVYGGVGPWASRDDAVRVEPVWQGERPRKTRKGLECTISVLLCVRLSLSAIRGYGWNSVVGKPGREPWPRTRPSWHPDLRLPSSRTMRNTCPLAKPPSHGILLERPEQTKTGCFSVTPFPPAKRQKALSPAPWTRPTSNLWPSCSMTWALNHLLVPEPLYLLELVVTH